MPSVRLAAQSAWRLIDLDAFCLREDVAWR
jgi:hypothetical protein